MNTPSTLPKYYRYLSVVLMTMLLASCGASDSIAPVTKESVVEAIENAPINPIQLEGQLSDIFVLGSKHTDLQRENMLKELVGSVVQWKLPVYEVSLADGVYKVQTNAKARDDGAVLLPAIVFITPRNDDDRRFIESLKTDDFVGFKGQVADVVLISYVIVEPAILVK